jgi:N-acetylmuramoyl-L-alanine amidase
MPQSYHKLIQVIMWLSLLFAASASAATAPKTYLVVLDPGHGGEDQGTSTMMPRTASMPARLITEKQVTLSLALEVARQLHARGIATALTRDTDQEVPLALRTTLANRLGADLFISIHMNSGQRRAATPGAEGIETYLLNNTTDASSRRLAELENKYANVNGGNVGSVQNDVALILKDLRLDANASESKRLACAIQSHAVQVWRQKDRGVRQALFYVLLGADMPSVLVEAGFLSSAKDRALVLSDVGRRRLGVAIAEAVDQFRRTKNTASAARALGRCKVR